MKKYTLTILFITLCVSVATSQKKKATTGAQDRAFWVKTLHRIAYPVVHNLANGTLKKNMPLEKGTKYALNLTKVTYLEALGRTMAGLASWLALPDDDTEEGKLRKNMREELLKGFGQFGESGECRLYELSQRIATHS
jgi:hypothetical protein